MNQPKKFEHPNFGELAVVGANDQLMFNLEDVAHALNYVKQAKGKKYIRYERVNAILQKLNIRTVVHDGQHFISESQLYDFIFESGTEKAKEFRRWVTDEVLPSIRKHGGYLTPETVEQVLTDPDTIIRLATDLKKERLMRQQAEFLIEKQKPKVLFADAVETSESSILIGQLAKLITQNGYPIGQNRLFKWLRDNGFLGKSGAHYNEPTQYAMERGWFEVKERTINNPDGSVRITRTTKVTGKGQIYFINKFLSLKEIG